MSWTQPPGVAGDQMALRRHNLSLVLRHLRDHGPRSRAHVAAETGLNKATVSSLVTELLDRGLIQVGMAERGGVGRPGRALELAGGTVCGVGAEVDVDRVSVVALDLRGDVVAERTVSRDIRTLLPQETVELLADLLIDVLAAVASRGALPAGIAVGVAGVVTSGDGQVVAAPNLGWRDVPFAALLAQHLDVPSPPLLVDNEGTLAAVGESVGRGPDRRDVVVLSGGVGLGGGLLSAGRLVRGRHGFAGEIGHLRIDPQGVECGCGRIGCWETLVGLRAFLAAAADPDDAIHDPSVSLGTRLAEVDRRAALGDARTLSALEQVGRWLGVGAAGLVNVLDPGVIVLSGYYAPLGRWLVGPMVREMVSGTIAPQAAGCRVELSDLGVRAVVRGGALAALEHVYSDPTVAPRITDVSTTNVSGGTR